MLLLKLGGSEGRYSRVDGVSVRGSEERLRGVMTWLDIELSDPFREGLVSSSWEEVNVTSSKKGVTTKTMNEV